MKKLLAFAIVSVLGWANNCLECHKGIEDIRDPHSGMAKAIAKKAAEAGFDGNSCIVCHGGNPQAITKEEAHKGTIAYFLKHEGPKEFYPDPGSAWINKNTCGMCHKEQVSTQMNNLMNTEQGKIQGALWGFGWNIREHKYANYNLTNLHKRLGSKTYQNYMKRLSQKEPQVYMKKTIELPPAPTIEEVEKNPKLAAITYLRQECLRCHTASKGRSRRGDYRGMGCSSCHIPYSNDGYYEGGDPTIPKNEPGHMLVHQIQGTRDAKVHIHGLTYSGIPVETCTTCHNRGKRIGVSYQGLMETAYNPTFDKHGKGQPKLHTKHYLHMSEDVHYKKGMLCQDCHTSIDMHGDGKIAGSTLAPVEIECQDCHGTPSKYPWELPLGYGDEFGQKLDNKPRGVTKTLAAYLKKGTHYEPKDGYLLSARGNPLPNVVKVGNEVVVHLASGKDLTLQPLKKLAKEHKLSQAGEVAMVQIGKHIEEMECYACHDTWAPQCYGCHVKVDYSKGKKNVDWLAVAHAHDIHGTDAAKRKNLKDYLIDGEVTETRSYLRWEDPILVRNGEGRIAPAIPGCQVSVTVIGKDGKAILQNHIFKTKDNNQEVLAIDMAPVHSHTVQKEARSCESCHNNPKSMGFGIDDGKVFGDPSKPLIVDLMTADGKVIPKKITIQKPGIKNLHFDWSRIIDENYTQLVTVGHHWGLSRALHKDELDKLDRRGVCMSCHQTIPDKDLAVSLMVHVAQTANININNDMHKNILHKNLLLSAWVQVGGGVLVLVGVFYWLIRRKRR
ncbi:cytochrome c family protein [Nitratiruptor sp. YY08-26]|uniref:multiheme c-type cytochrome n=1 Tax=unclassified Nitratiruptor TaxID=2624044 RepID=UPI0019169D22|nr:MULTISPECIES: cytochrome C [unclassified Nitratiruptor]BCD61310.1 cytochrome c family protein [Nitratiruptor sp. YY08-13]BCD65243.1 cytochrome c family protein [Nitratiruptor sp. YY08-26]